MTLIIAVNLIITLYENVMSVYHCRFRQISAHRCATPPLKKLQADCITSIFIILFSFILY